MYVTQRPPMLKDWDVIRVPFPSLQGIRRWVEGGQVTGGIGVVDKSRKIIKQDIHVLRALFQYLGLFFQISSSNSHFYSIFLSSHLLTLRFSRYMCRGYKVTDEVLRMAEEEARPKGFYACMSWLLQWAKPYFHFMDPIRLSLTEAWLKNEFLHRDTSCILFHVASRVNKHASSRTFGNRHFFVKSTATISSI